MRELRGQLDAVLSRQFEPVLDSDSDPPPSGAS